MAWTSSNDNNAMEVGGNNVKKAPPPASAAASLKQEDRSTTKKPVASISSSSSEEEEDSHHVAAASSSSTLRTAQRAPASGHIQLLLETKKAAAAIVEVDSDDDDDNNDGIHRVSWNSFLRFNVPPQREKKKKKAKPTRTNDTSAVANCLKRKREESSSTNDNKKEIDAAKKIKMSWKGRFAQLRQYSEENGDTRVPRDNKQDQSFANWVHVQRGNYTKRIRGEDPKALSDRRFALLQSLGFGAQERRENDPYFRKRLDQLHAFKSVFNHMKVPKHYDIVPGLHKWIKKIRKSPELLTDDEKWALGDIGFECPTIQASNKCDSHNEGNESDQKKKALNATWVKRINQLKEYHREFGNFRVPRNNEKDPSLEAWVKTQRKKFTERKRGKKGVLANHKFEALEKIGFDASLERPKENAGNATWAKRMEQLKLYKEEHGNCRVPTNYKKDPALGTWVHSQRKKFTLFKRGHTGFLAAHKIEALEKLGFEVSVRKQNTQVDFSTRLTQLDAFKKEFGHILVPKNGVQMNVAPGLRSWIVEVRHMYSEKERGYPSELSDDQIRSLNDRGFVWSKKKNRNNLGENKMESNGKIEAEMNVVGNNGSSKKTPSLSRSIDKEVGLSGIDSTTTWESNFEKLKRFKTTHGHCKLDRKTRQDDSSFALWVTKQRGLFTLKMRGDNVLGEAKFLALKNLGFEPSITHGMSEAGFVKKLSFLEFFKREYGHTRVPADNAIPGLRRWVVHVREAFRRKRNGEESDITEDQIDTLDDLDFEWTVPEEEDAPPLTSKCIKRLKRLKKVAPEKSPVGPVRAQGSGVTFTFTQRLDQIEAYHRKYEHVNVPPDYREAPGLRNWLDRMRQQYTTNRKSIPEEKRAKLASLKIDWLMKVPSPNSNRARPGRFEKVPAKSWLCQFKELVEYEAAHGDTRIPKRYKPDQSFAAWVHEQRKHFSKRCSGDEAALGDERFSALKQLGFEIARMDEPSPVFNQRISELEDFYGIFGHTKVHKTYNAAPGLHKWLAATRIKYKLLEEGDPTAVSVRELEILDALDFDWLGRKGKFASKKKDDSPSKYLEDATKPDTSWEGRLQQLEDFKTAHGHINIPTVYETDQSFSNWVRTQKRLFTRREKGVTDALSDDRSSALKMLGFEASANR